MDYNAKSRFPQQLNPLLWLVLAFLILGSGLTIAGYQFKLSFGVSPAEVQFQIEGSPGRILPPVPLIERR